MLGDGRLLSDRPVTDFADAEQLATAYQRLLAPAAGEAGEEGRP